MNDFVHLLQQGNAWLFVPSAILLGALHGLEPGHSKTMMAAFIVAIRGTVGQAVLLGLSATFSHTAVVWIVAMSGMYFGRNWNVATTEPYFQLASSAMIVAVALWMLWRTRRNQRDATGAHDHDHGHRHGNHGHGHDHGDAHGQHRHGHDPDHEHPRHGHAHGHEHGSDHNHDRHLTFVALGAHATADDDGLDVIAPGYNDPHELAHANDIRRRFANREVTTAQIVVFGLTGGLVPCPASITVLLLCLQLKKIALGAGLVLCFSIGLAMTMVLSGTLAALSVRHVSKRWRGFGEFARVAPYFSGALILLVGAWVGYQGWVGLAALH